MNSRKQQTILALEHSFVTLVLEQGYKKVSVIQIAQGAGINPKTFYNHYHDKNDLAQQLADAFLAQYGAIFDERVVTYETLLHRQAPRLVESWMNQQIHAPEFERRYRALKTIDTPEFNFLQQFDAMMTHKVLASKITGDPLIAQIVAAVTIKTIDYYVETGENYSFERSRTMLRTLEKLV